MSESKWWETWAGKQSELVECFEIPERKRFLINTFPDYDPPMVQVMMGSDHYFELRPQDARKLAEALMRGADKAEAEQSAADVAVLDATMNGPRVAESIPPHEMVIEIEDRPCFPCDMCGVLRTKAEGGTVFTVCDQCWDKHYSGLRADKIKEKHDPPATDIPDGGRLIDGGG